MLLNIDRNWTRLVKLRCKLMRKVQVTNDRAPLDVQPKRRH